jgi:preprotein translocase subunit SecA
MIKKIFSFLFRDYIDEWKPIVEKINSLEKDFEKFSDDDLKNKTLEFKERIKNGESLDKILPEAFAAVREAAKRTLGQRHFDVQLLGGIGLHKGMVIEMMTGEGKTITATLAAYLNALTGEGVHIVTVNDYLAQRDTVWMGQIYHFLGLSVACIVSENRSYIYDPTFVPSEEDKERDILGTFKVFHEYLRPISRKEAYLADIVYGTNSEFGFDYLRDNLATSPDQIVQVKDLNYAIIDEVDSILIDEAKTPLLIGAYQIEDVSLYYFYDKLAKSLEKDIDFTLEEKSRRVFLTEEGLNKIQRFLGYNPYEVIDLRAAHHIEQALIANYLYHRDKDYIVKNDEVIIVDEFTGRLMYGRRWSGGLHQAIEAKEGVPVRPEMRTQATITIQNFFKKYKKIAGMTGTAWTSREEFKQVYNLEVVRIPPNKPCIRIDHPDKIFITQKAKWKAVVNKIKELYEIGRPVLVGTTSIENNEKLSKMLTEAGIPHRVLNAKNHEEEGAIIAQAGKLKAVTVATNMAGRGVDILLGGNPQDPEEYKKVKELGGLFVIGTERHEARRIDNQLRGRAGRQGDPGETQFFISLEDDLMRTFGSDEFISLLERLGINKDSELFEEVDFDHPLLLKFRELASKTIEEVQKKIEGHNLDIRKRLLEYDTVINAQREKIYHERKGVLLGLIDFENFVLENFEKLLNDASDDVLNFIFRTSDKEEIKKRFFEKFNLLKEEAEENFYEIVKQVL